MHGTNVDGLSLVRTVCALGRVGLPCVAPGLNCFHRVVIAIILHGGVAARGDFWALRAVRPVNVTWHLGTCEVFFANDEDLYVFSLGEYG